MDRKPRDGAGSGGRTGILELELKASHGTYLGRSGRGLHRGFFLAMSREEKDGCSDLRQRQEAE